MELPSGEERLKYKCSLSVCPNPLCNCRELTLSMNLDKELSSADGPEKATVSFDVDGNKLNVGKTPTGDIPFARRILEHMDESDWKILWQTYYALKRGYAINTPIEDLDFDFNKIYGCDYGAVDGGKMICSDDVFPFSEKLLLEINGKTCVAMPMFCLALDCKCTDAALEIQTPEAHEFYLTVCIDYKKGVFSEYNNSQWHDKDLTKDMLASILLGVYPDLLERLQEKHRRLAKLYKISRAKYFKGGKNKNKWNPDAPFDSLGEPLEDNWNCNDSFDTLAETFIREKSKIGRNDPCPCGSGKKYKKCCLK
ncbi:MAG: hypothetical protein A2X45_09805 [Lentisphaerae bacterium GWF2_50_93]|nr:MAG: hypothetical protein A2X45_09805 [Lentisphaerae bacterium GWF2_50_93]